MKYNNTQGYSVIISMLLIGFLLVLTTTVFNLVLRELRDTRGLWNSIQAFAWAEAAQELALLKIKEKWYGIDHKVEHFTNSDSIILSENPDNISTFKKNKDVLISYDLSVSTDNYSEELIPQSYSIIPLFTQSEWDINSISILNYTLSVNSWNWSNLVWNLIAWEKGMSWTGDDTTRWTGKEFNWGVSTFNTQWVSDFLRVNNDAYLILFHSWNSWNGNITFTINSSAKFSKPKTQIISSAQVGDYRHNLQTDYDNTQFLNMLKYSVFSN